MSRLVIDCSSQEIRVEDYTPPVPTQAEREAAIRAELTDAVQRHLDDTAKAAGYDSIISAITYADEPAVSEYQAEGQAFRAWRSQVWAYCYTVLVACQAGERPVPTEAELIAELPALVLEG